MTGELPPQTAVTLSCGHTGAVWGPAKVGTWVSCWAVVINGGGNITDSCQTQRKITGVKQVTP